MWPFRKAPPIAILTCQGEGCNKTFEVDEAPGLPDHVKSMSAAVKAHEAGWYAAGGPVLCPDCALEFKAKD